MGEENRAPAKRFEDLIVWQKAHRAVLQIYGLTRGLPKEELYGLTSQLRRSAVSVPANIAEGFRATTRAQKARYLGIAHNSLEETRYYLRLVKDLEYAQTDGLMEDVSEVSRILHGYRRGVLASR